MNILHLSHNLKRRPMKKYIFTTLLAVALAAGFLASCSDDEDNSPSISLSETNVTAAAGR
jgi:hypothetical protein